jgi:hypothetical protein
VGEVVSSRSRGNAYEKEVKDILVGQGFIVEKALPRLVWIPGRRVPISSSHDFFGCWDLVAKKKGHKTLWVQVSTWEHMSHKRTQVKDFPWFEDVDVCAIYARVRGGGKDKACFRIAYAHEDYVWNGATADIPK